VKNYIALVAQAEADGYSLMAVSSSLWLRPFFQTDVGYDPVKDFAPVTLVATSPSVLVVRPGVPVSPGLALAKAISSATALTGNDGFTTSTFTSLASSEIGEKSLATS